MSDMHPEVFRHEGFGRKVGPLPIWGWALVLVAVMFVWMRFGGALTGGGGNSGAAASATGQSLPNIMTTGGYLPPSSGTGPTPSSGFTDNQSWENSALQQASTFGSTPVSLQQALDKYLAGGALDPTQTSVINKVIQALGAAPLGTMGTPTTTAPPVTSTPAPVVKNPLIAAGLYAPTFSGNYVQDTHTGLIAEVEKDGSLLGLTPSEWSAAAAKNGGAINKIGHIGNTFSVESNLQNVGK